MSPSVRDNALEASIKAACKQLRLPTIGARAGQVAQEAARAKQSHLAYLWALVESELEDRGDRRRHRRIRDAKFPRLKTVDDFNFEEASHIPAAAIYELATCGFVDKAEPVIFIGDSRAGDHPRDQRPHNPSY